MSSNSFFENDNNTTPLLNDRDIYDNDNNSCCSSGSIKNDVNIIHQVLDEDRRNLLIKQQLNNENNINDLYKKKQIYNNDKIINIGILCYALISGSAFLFTKQASQNVPPASLTALRMSIGSTSLLLSHIIFFGFRKTINIFQNEIYNNINWIFIVGAFNTTIPYTLYAVALTNGIDVSVAAVLSGMAPLLVSLLTYSGIYILIY
jgi:hypothetical protein